ncbi:hypothetical protein GCM10011488_67840 [Steroidobacter agaridevorans]|nr:hypothetical protein GCM10011488_67840 [Steroidobacter agaridevorans]
MPSVQVIVEPAAVAARLETMQLTEEILRESLYQAYLHRVRLTPNHPPSFPGLEMWGWAVASLREQLRSRDWVPVNFGNYSLTVHEELALAINVASGDEATGYAKGNPTTRSKKGPNTADAVEVNRQSDLFAELLPPPHPEQRLKAADFTTWLLLHHIDMRKQELRAELSRPTEMDDDGRVSRWTDRIILPPISFDGDRIELAPPAGPSSDFDIEIRRKS